MSGLGHNGGPTLEPGYGFRKACWTRARRDLLPNLPLQIVRIHVARAKRLGLEYRTYATVRATAGRDIVAFLFSGNALRLEPRQIDLPDPVAARLRDLPTDRIAAIYASNGPEAVLRANSDALDVTGLAPAFTDSWTVSRTRLDALLGDSLPRRGVVLVAATAVEREWGAMARLGSTLTAEQVFATPSTV